MHIYQTIEKNNKHFVTGFQHISDKDIKNLTTAQKRFLTKKPVQKEWMQNGRFVYYFDDGKIKKDDQKDRDSIHKKIQRLSDKKIDLIECLGQTDYKVVRAMDHGISNGKYGKPVDLEILNKRQSQRLKISEIEKNVDSLKKELEKYDIDK